jgi:hypothetical protein
MLRAVHLAMAPPPGETAVASAAQQRTKHRSPHTVNPPFCLTRCAMHTAHLCCDRAADRFNRCNNGTGDTRGQHQHEGGITALQKNQILHGLCTPMPSLCEPGQRHGHSLGRRDS